MEESTTTSTSARRPNSLPEQVATCALQHYHTQLGSQKGKPKPDEEWTVYAAVVAYHSATSHLWVVSCATGTKCTTQRHDGCILHDCHAEVLARRGLIRVLWTELLAKSRTTGGSKESLQADANSEDRATSSFPGGGAKPLLVKSLTWSSGGGGDDDGQYQKYQMDPKIQLYLYISDSPCGDASIYSVDDIAVATTSPPQERRQSQSVLYTGAKVVVSRANGVEATDCGGAHQLLALSERATTASDGTAGSDAQPAVRPSFDADAKIAREEIQVLGKLRTKAGRSNLPDHMRSTSMSCSDKIVMWGTLGMQGGLLTKHFYPPLIPLAGVVVSRDSRSDENDGQNQRQALERAICDRVANVWHCLENKTGTTSKGAKVAPPWKPQIPSVHLVSQVFESGKAAMALTASRPATTQRMGRKRKLDGGGEFVKKKGINNDAAKISPCGVSLNWNQSAAVDSTADRASSILELVVGARGIKHGKKPKSMHDYKNLASRLSRARIMHDFLWPLELPSLPHQTDHHIVVQPHHNRGYHQLKEATSFPEWRHLKKVILSEEGGGPLAGWLRSVDGGQDDFKPNGNA